MSDVPVDDKELSAWADYSRMGRYELEDRFRAAVAEIRRLRNPGSGKQVIVPWPGYVVAKCLDPATQCLACDRLGYHFEPEPPKCGACGKAVDPMPLPNATLKQWIDRAPGTVWACSAPCADAIRKKDRADVPQLVATRDPVEERLLARRKAAEAKAPVWMNQQVEQFADLVELMVLAFIFKHGKRPKLFTDDRVSEGQMVAFLDAHFVADDGEGVHPDLSALALQLGPKWTSRFPEIPPDGAVVYMTVEPGSCRVTVELRTPELEEDLAKRSATVAAMISEMRKGMH